MAAAALPWILGSARTARMMRPLWRLGKKTYARKPWQDVRYADTAAGTGGRTSTAFETIFPPKTGGARTLEAFTREPGFVKRHPFIGYGGTAAALGATPALFSGGEEEAPMPMAIPSQTRGVGPPSVLPSALERSKSARQKWMKNLQTATMYGGILGAIDPDKKESFNKDVSEAMKQMSGYTQNTELAKISDAALKAGQTPRERYMAMITEGATPEEAALVSGHQVELMKAEQTSMGAKAQVWDQIMQTLMAGDTQTAALMLVQAWGTNQLGGAPMSENLQVRMEAATALLTGIASGETSPTAPGAGSGITDISLA